MQHKFFAAGAFALAVGQAFAAEPVSNVDEMVVTASRVPESIKTLPASVTVLTARDIEQSGARTVQQVLSQQAGVHFFSNSGSDNGVVDLRGFGMTGSDNTLVLVDGFRQNNNDQSAPNLAQIPLDQIERIEIVRGSGAVQYGGGSTGGVINIITRSGFNARDTVRATVTGGSFYHKQVDASLHLNSEQLAFDGYVQSLDTDHWRNNNAERRQSGGLALSLRNDDGLVKFFLRASDQDLRLPGGRRVDRANGIDQFASDPRGTSTPNDYSETKSVEGGAQGQYRLGSGTLYAEAGKRHKDSLGFFDDYANVGQPWYSPYVDDRRLDEHYVNARYELPLAGGHRVVAGYDWRDTELDARAGYPAPVLPSFAVKQTQRGAFLDTHWQVADATHLNAGVRRQWIDEHVDNYTGFGFQGDKQPTLNAFNLGVRQGLGQGVSAYARWGQSFRVANADELIYTNDGLKPQTSHDTELGLDWVGAAASASASVFQYDLNNEIHFNRLSGAFGSNVNLDPTRRRGMELAGRIELTPALKLHANATWQRATFREGMAGGVELAGNTVPMVPTWLANAGASWQPLDALTLTGSVQYVGSQRMDNDQANRYDTKLAAYTLLNVGARYRINKSVETALNVYNLTDKRYASWGALSLPLGPSAYNLIPGEGRNIQASLTVKY